MGRGKLRWRVCRCKLAYGRKTAMAVAARLRLKGVHVSAYRCPFDPDHWHIGGAPSMQTLELLAEMLRERQAERGCSLSISLAA